MPPVLLLRPRVVIKIFQKLGWQVARQRGSHIIMTKAGHIATLSIPTILKLPEEPSEVCSSAQVLLSKNL
jgi:predicted RNA binding protein YcfA (HicA-like mRNA interferase family)